MDKRNECWTNGHAEVQHNIIKEWIEIQLAQSNDFRNPADVFVVCMELAELNSIINFMLKLI